MTMKTTQPLQNEDPSCLNVQYDNDLYTLCEDIVAMQKPQRIAKTNPSAFDEEMREKMERGLQLATDLANTGNIHAPATTASLARMATIENYATARDSLHEGFNLIRDGGTFDPAEIFHFYGVAKANEKVNQCEQIVDAEGSSEIEKTLAHQLPIESNCHSIALVDQEILRLLTEGHFLSIDEAYARIGANAYTERTQGLLEINTTVSPVTIERTPIGNDYSSGSYVNENFGIGYRQSLFDHYLLKFIPPPAATAQILATHLSGDADTLGSHREAIGLGLTLEQPFYEYYANHFVAAIGATASGGFLLSNNNLNYGLGYVPESRLSFDARGDAALTLSASFYKMGRLSLAGGAMLDQTLVSSEKFRITGWYGRVSLATPLPQIQTRKTKSD